MLTAKEAYIITHLQDKLILSKWEREGETEFLQFVCGSLEKGELQISSSTNFFETPKVKYSIVLREEETFIVIDKNEHEIIEYKISFEDAEKNKLSLINDTQILIYNRRSFL